MRRYLARLSGPLLDRVDVKVELLPVGRAELLSDRKLAEPSAVVAARVAEARARAAARLAGTPWQRNGEIPGSELRRRFRPAAGVLAPLERAMDLGQVSARGARERELATRMVMQWPGNAEDRDVSGGGP